VIRARKTAKSSFPRGASEREFPTLQFSRRQFVKERRRDERG
jgi:hypothetical protein